jgi:hypothetical protein
MDQDQSAIVRRRLEEEGIDALTLLNVLVQTLTKRHVDCEFEKLGRPIPTRGGQPRRNALVATQDALHEGQARNAPTDPQLAAMQNTLFHLLTECQFAAEKQAGIDGDDEPPGHMRLVRD